MSKQASAHNLHVELGDIARLDWQEIWLRHWALVHYFGPLLWFFPQLTTVGWSLHLKKTPLPYFTMRGLIYSQFSPTITG